MLVSLTKNEIGKVTSRPRTETSKSRVFGNRDAPGGFVLLARSRTYFADRRDGSATVYVLPGNEGSGSSARLRLPPE